MSPWLHPSGGVIISDFHCMIANIIHKNNNIAKLIENLKNGCDRSKSSSASFYLLSWSKHQICNAQFLYCSNSVRPCTNWSHTCKSKLSVEPHSCSAMVSLHYSKWRRKITAREDNKSIIKLSINSSTACPSPMLHSTL